MLSHRSGLLIAFSMLIILAVLSFILENQQPVTIRYFSWAAPELPASILMIIALLLGMVLGPFLVATHLMGTANRKTDSHAKINAKSLN